jgi:hypothetical protein
VLSAVPFPAIRGYFLAVLLRSKLSPQPNLSLLMTFFNSFLIFILPLSPLCLFHNSILLLLTMLLSTSVVLGLFASLFSTVHGHGTMVAIQGANGVTAAGMGIIASTPRNGALPVPFEVSVWLVQLHVELPNCDEL